MRYQGRVSEWKDDRGFCFIAPNGGGARIFLHISAFSMRNRRPSVGNLVTYELGADERGRPQAKVAQFVGEPLHVVHGKRPNGVAVILLATAVLSLIAYVAYVRISHPNSTVSASVYKILRERRFVRIHNSSANQPSHHARA